MALDWSLLSPHRPLPPGAPEYAPPPTGGGQAIAEWIRAGGTTVLVGGPVGVGKSTELAHAAKLLQGDRVTCLVRVDRSENIRSLTSNRLLLCIASTVAFVSISNLRLDLSHELRAALHQAGVLDVGLLDGAIMGSYEASASGLAHLVIREAARLSTQGRVALLVDGLEKAPPGTATLELFDALGDLSEEADVVTTVPWHMAFGPIAGEALVRTGEHFESLRVGNRDFLLEILAKRWSVQKTSFRSRVTNLHDRGNGTVYEQAADWSGGLPRSFLQLVSDAGVYSRLRGALKLEERDLHRAVLDQMDSYRRVLLPGDSDALRASKGTDGRELDPVRKTRLMSTGLLLERVAGGRIKLEIHPIVEEYINREPLDA